MTDAIAAMRCWVSPRPAISLASRSGIIWAADSRWRGTSWFSHSITISGDDSARPDQQVRPGFAPLTDFAVNRLVWTCHLFIMATDESGWTSRLATASFAVAAY